MMDNTVCSLRMRMLLFLLPLLLACGLSTTASAQIVQLANESFKKSLPQGWSAYPASTPTAPTWASDTHVTASGKYAMHGYVPYNSGDTVELVTPFYDCSNYKHVQLRFKHICKVLGSDMCQVMYRENNVSSRWKPIPADAYKGACKAYKAKLIFDHASYTEWKSTDTFAVPTADWYKDEVFDLSDYVGYSTVAFKFVIKKGSFFSSFIAEGWYLDDFEVNVSNISMALPAVNFLIIYADTLNTTGPFTINAKVATRTTAPIVQPWLHYTASTDTSSHRDSILMAKFRGDTIWIAEIPQQPYGTDITYYIIGSDSVGNKSRADGHFFLKYKPDVILTDAVTMYSIDNPKVGAVSGRQQVRVTIRNRGTNPLTRASLGWSVNGVLQAPKVWTGSLKTDMGDTVNLGTYIQRYAAKDF